MIVDEYVDCFVVLCKCYCVCIQYCVEIQKFKGCLCIVVYVGGIQGLVVVGLCIENGDFYGDFGEGSFVMIVWKLGLFQLFCIGCELFVIVDCLSIVSLVQEGIFFLLISFEGILNKKF